MKKLWTKIKTWYERNFDNHYLLPQIYYAVGMVAFPTIITLVLAHFDLLGEYISMVFIGTYALLLAGTLFIMRKDIKKEFIDKPVTKELLIKIGLGFCVLYFFNEFGSELLAAIIERFNIGAGAVVSENQQMFEALMMMFGGQMGGLALMGAALEELIFRYSMMNYIRNRKAAVIISAVTFASMHISAISLTELIMLSLYLTLGFIFSITYEKTKDIRITTVMHLLNNGLASLLQLI